MRLVGTILAVVLLAIQASGATYYIDYAAGNDASAGTAKATAWKRAPGMVGFAGAYTHSAGDRFIFKGGVTWPRSCFRWTISNKDGTAGAPDYYGVDATWFTGGSFTQPTLDFENTPIGFAITGSGMYLDQCDNVTIDNLHFYRHAAPIATAGESIWGIMSAGCNYGSNITFTNCFFDRWWQPNTAGVIADGKSTGGGISVYKTANARATHCRFTQEGGETRNGSCTWNVGTVDNCEMWDCATAIMSANLWYDNYIHDLKTPGDRLAHANGALCYDNQTAYRNVLVNLPGQAMPFLICQRGVGSRQRIWDNVFINCVAPPIQLDARYRTDGDTTSETYIFNNTVEGQSLTGSCIRFGNGTHGAYPYVEIRNNHFITSGTVNYVDLAPTVLVQDPNLTQTPEQAASFGMTRDNRYAPILGESPTVGTGEDLSTFFTYDLNNRTRTVPWDIGAYEFSGSGAPGTLAIESATYSTTEDTTLTFTIPRTSGTTGTVGASYATEDGTALAGTDYTAASSTVSLGNGVSSTTFSITILRNASYTGNRYFNVVLSAPTGGAILGAPATATVTIIDSDTEAEPLVVPTLGLSFKATNMLMVAPFEVRDGSVYNPVASSTTNTSGALIADFVIATPGTYQLEVTGNWPSTSSDSYFVQVEGTNDVFHVIPDTIGMEARWVSWQGSGSYSAPEKQPARFTFPAGTYRLIVWSREAGTTLNNLTWTAIAEPVTQQIYLTASSAWVYDSGGAAQLTVTRTAGTGTATVDYATSDGTAIAGTDYTSTSGTLTFAEGVLTQVISVPVVNHPLYVGDKTFSLTLSNPSEATLANPSAAAIAILDDVTPLPPSALNVNTLHINQIVPRGL